MHAESHDPYLLPTVIEAVENFHHEYPFHFPPSAKPVARRRCRINRAPTCRSRLSRSVRPITAIRKITVYLMTGVSMEYVTDDRIRAALPAIRFRWI